MFQIFKCRHVQIRGYDYGRIKNSEKLLKYVDFYTVSYPLFRFVPFFLCFFSSSPSDAGLRLTRSIKLLTQKRRMEGDTFSGLNNGTAQVDGKILQTFKKSFVQVQNILDQNKLLINEINQNHESKIPDNLSRNVDLIRELNNNIRRVVDLYADLSSSFTKSVDVSSEGDSSGALKSDGKAGHKRHRPA